MEDQCCGADVAHFRYLLPTSVGVMEMASRCHILLEDFLREGNLLTVSSQLLLASCGIWGMPWSARMTDWCCTERPPHCCRLQTGERQRCLFWLSSSSHQRASCNDLTVSDGGIF